MATTLVGAVWERLVGDATVRAWVTTFNGLPAVFTAEPVPLDAVRPYIALGPPVDETRMDTKTTRGYEHVRDLWVYTDADGSGVKIEQGVAAVKAAFHRRPVCWAGVRGIVTEVVRDTDIPNDGTIYGRAVTIRLEVEEV